jgi:pSer/pThr/pTyr-binding forkhead associated (FHA) protein
MESPLALHRASAGELKARLDADRRGHPYLIYFDGSGSQKLVDLELLGTHATVGRQPQSDIALEWDSEVSRTHAELERIGTEWTVVDDGRARNGSFVNGVRLRGRRRLRDGDAIRVGRSILHFRAPALHSEPTAESTAARVPRLTETQRDILMALCRPLVDSPVAAPASNRQIAAEVVISVETVKSQLRRLFAAFAIGELPQNQKRAQLARVALERGAVDAGELVRDAPAG